MEASTNKKCRELAKKTVCGAKTQQIRLIADVIWCTFFQFWNMSCATERNQERDVLKVALSNPDMHSGKLSEYRDLHVNPKWLWPKKKSMQKSSEENRTNEPRDSPTKQGQYIKFHSHNLENKTISLPVRNVKFSVGPRNPCQWVVRKRSWRPPWTDTVDTRIHRCGWPRFAECPRTDHGTNSGTGHSQCRTWKSKKISIFRSTTFPLMYNTLYLQCPEPWSVSVPGLSKWKMKRSPKDKSLDKQWY